MWNLITLVIMACLAYAAIRVFFWFLRVGLMVSEFLAKAILVTAFFILVVWALFH
jgi:hypothetical protein